MITIGLIDDHPSILAGLQATLSKTFKVEFVTTSPDESIKLIRSTKPEVLIVDIIFPNVNYIDFYTTLRKTFPEVRIISYSSLSNPILIQTLKKLGVSKFINKKEPIAKLEHAINDIFIHQNPLFRNQKSEINLTAIEIEIVRQLALGQTTKQIASLFNRSHRTIENHRSNIMSKLECGNVSELISKCYQLGFLN